MMHIIIISLLIVINISGCANIENFKESKVSDTEKAEEGDIKTKPNFKHPFRPNFPPPSIRAAMSMVVYRTEVIEQFGEPRETRKEGEYTYDIWNMEDGSKVFALYSGIMKDKLNDIWQFKIIPTNKMFEELSINKSTFKKDVRKIDPYACLWKPIPLEHNDIIFSEHRVANGTLVRVEYADIDGSLIVQKIEYNLPDFYNFYTIINPNNTTGQQSSH